MCKIHGNSNTEESDEVVIGGAGLLPVYIELPLLSHRLNLMLNEHGGGLLLNWYCSLSMFVICTIVIYCVILLIGSFCI